jgi:hypothetical protein
MEFIDMGGVKGRSGPPGNMNAVRSVVPALRRLRQGKPLPPELARVTALADQEAELLVSDKGGLDNMSGGERLLLNVWRTARQATLLILSEMAARGAIAAEGDKWDLQPGAQRLAKFLSEERAALLGLGLQRTAKNTDDIVAQARRLAAEQQAQWAQNDEEEGNEANQDQAAV